MGDFNQCIPPTKHNEHVFADLRTAFSAGFCITTEGKMDVDGQPLIDHIATTKPLDFSLTATIGRNADKGRPVSDHPGLLGILTRRG
jgi:endonuclease/exonuclease/phosphatase family metal-dependent hydrolase